MRLSPAKLAVRSLVAGALAGTIATFGFGTIAGAQNIANFNSDQPVSFNADRIELQDRQNRVVLTGDVIITQGDLRLTAARTTISYNDTGTLTIQRLDATGGVVVTRGDERARGDSGVYDFNRSVIILTGGVAINRGTDRLDGGRLVIDLNSGVSSVDGAAARPSGNAPGNRVSGTFAVPQDN